MNNRIKLTHLTVVGNDLQPATIEFGEKLTVIHGASDTGKSHVFDLIRYAFGLDKSIEMPDEGKGYQYVHLGLKTSIESTVTLIRDLAGGKIGVADGDVRELAPLPLTEYLDPRHVSKNPDSASRRLLRHIGLDEMFVRKNQYNETRMLEWRDVIRLTAVDEESIITKRSPIESGQHIQRSVEAAIFRLFIQGNDDSGLVPIPKPAELKKISANKLEVLDRIIEDLECELNDSPPLDQLREQLSRLNASLSSASAALNEVSAKRDSLIIQRSEHANSVANLQERLDETVSLSSRFRLLRTQYDSDLSRLDMLAQVADVLSVEDERTCPFCGAQAEHQHWEELNSEATDTEIFTVAIVSEHAKILALRAELQQTIDAIQREQLEINDRIASLIDRNRVITEEVRRYDEDMSTPGSNLAMLLEVRSEVERQINTHTHRSDLIALRASTAQVEKPKTSTEISIVSDDLLQFDRIAEEILRKWSFPIGNSVNYSVSERDVIVDQRPRKARGKGVRSILHALFNVTLAEYCLRRGYKHPGFIILDSPIVSYRQAGAPQLEGEDETISINVVDAFYSFLQNEFRGQSLILENKSPTSPLPIGSREYFFSGTDSNSERPGFYPYPRDEHY